MSHCDYGSARFYVVNLDNCSWGVSFFEVGHVAATLLILRDTQQLTPSLGLQTATQVALWFYTAYNVAATLASIPAGRAAIKGERLEY